MLHSKKTIQVEQNNAAEEAETILTGDRLHKLADAW